MRLSIIGFLVLPMFVARAFCASTTSQVFTTPLATGVRLDPEGAFVDLGSMPLNMAFAPDGKEIVAVLSGWREQGIQVIDLVSKKVTQTLFQDAAFYGLAFSADGEHLYVSGGNEDLIYCYAWQNGMAKLENKIVVGQKKPDKTGSRYPAGLATSKRGNMLYVAENVGDSLAVVDPASGKVAQRFPTDHYPYAVEASQDGRVYVSAWGGRTASVFRTQENGTLLYIGRFSIGPRPSALISSADGSLLYAVLAGSDRIAVVDTSSKTVLGYLFDQAPGAPPEGSTPNALALSGDDSKLYAAEADNNAIAIFDVSRHNLSRIRQSGIQPIGRIPTDWYPTAVGERGGQLLVLSGKGHGSHANPDGPIPGEGIKRPLGYDLGQLSGTLRICRANLNTSELQEYSRRVAQANRWDSGQSLRHYPPFKHVVYIIKENRTYDQVLGDVKEADGDAGLVFFGRDVTPNHHALALRFGLFDRFFTNAEVSSQGHIWSTAAYVTDYDEKTVPSLYSDRRGNIDGEEIDEPLRGFLWTLAAQKGIWFRDYGEMVNGPEGWPVTQPGVVPDVSPSYPPFNLQIMDQKRADSWIDELRDFVQRGEMPALEIMHLPSDHTAGGHAGYRSPRAYVADNDLALGRIIEALSNTRFWRDTVVFVVEDDSQAGPDHVDSHRSPFFAISAYSRRGAIHRFANTTDVVAAIEDILSLGRLSKFDYFSRPLTDLFTDTPDLTPYQALTPQANINEMNPSAGAAAEMSENLDLSAPDRVNDQTFNRILWLMMKPKMRASSVTSKAPLQLLLSSN